MAINKNFVVKNGLEVSNGLIYADADISSVGIGTTIINYNLHVIGGIGATNSYVTGISTFNNVDINGTFSVGVVTATSVYADNIDLTGASLSLNSVTTGVSTSGNISIGVAGTTITTIDGGKVGIGTTNALHRFQVGSANATGVTTTSSGLFVITYDGKVGVQTGQPLTSLHVFGNQIVTGVITATTFNGQINSGVGTITSLSVGQLNPTSANIGVATISNLTGTNISYSGISTFSNVDINGGTINASNGYINVGILTYISGSNLNYSGIGSISTLDSTVGTIDYLSGINVNYSGIGTISNVKIQNSQIQAVSGIATYYGDGSKLSGVTYGVGIRSDGSVIAGSGVTVLNFTGSGIGTITAASGIATIYVEGGSGGGGTPIQIAVTDDTSSSTTQYVVFTSGSGATQDLKVDTSLLSYVPSTNTIHANLTGTATTATLATTATGANNINISATSSTDTTTSVVLVGSQTTGNQSPFIDSGLTYNANTNNLSAATFTGSLSGNATSATTATNATNTTITNTTTSASTHYITFVDGTSGNRAQRVDSTGLTYIPDTNTIGADITGNAATVTTNANLTGDVTSTGNATAIASGVIDNDNISASAAIAVSKLSASTISGVTLGNNLATLTRGTYLTGSNYNGSTARTWSVDATSTNTASKVVARDSSGNFAANEITCLNLNATGSITAGSFTITNLNAVNGNFTGIVTATDFNSTSDINFKKDIVTFENALDTTNKLRGVNFTWKEDDRKSIGVVAQEIEKVLPELVIESQDHKTVNYNGLIGVLIEAVKELSAKVEYIEQKIDK